MQYGPEIGVVEKVKVARPTGIEFEDVSTLPEGCRLEYYAAKQFLKILNIGRHVPYEVDVLQDSPDVACTPEPFFIEVATVFDTPTDAPKLFGRAEGIGGVREIHAAILQVNKILKDKSSKRYGVDNCVLVIRHAVPVFTGNDFRRFRDEFVIPDNHAFSGIYLLAFLETDGMLRLGGDLVCLFPV